MSTPDIVFMCIFSFMFGVLVSVFSGWLNRATSSLGSVEVLHLRKDVEAIKQVLDQVVEKQDSQQPSGQMTFKK